MCVYTCVSAYVYTCVCACVYLCVCACVCLTMHSCASVCLYVLEDAFVCVGITRAEIQCYGWEARVHYTLAAMALAVGLTFTTPQPQLLTCNTPWKELGGEAPHTGGTCALGKTGRTGLQRARYFQELTWWAPFLQSAQVLPGDWWLSLWLAKLFLQKLCVWLACIPLHQNHIYTGLPLSLWSSLAELSWRAAVLILPQRKL